MMMMMMRKNEAASNENNERVCKYIFSAFSRALQRLHKQEVAAHAIDSMSSIIEIKFWDRDSVG